MTDRTYALTDTGVIVTDDGRVSIPFDPGNADYARFLEATGKTHETVLAEAAVLAAAKAADETRTRTAHTKNLRSARAKLLKLGITLPEFRALFTDPDPDQ